MDVSFKSGNEKFNYRVCAMMISDGRILAMHDERSPYYYLPGGRVEIGETAENAVIREVQEELGVTPKIARPLWLNQAFFTEDVDNLHYHDRTNVVGNGLQLKSTIDYVTLGMTQEQAEEWQRHTEAEFVDRNEPALFHCLTSLFLLS